MKIALLLSTVLAARTAFACAVTITVPAQEQVRGAREVAEVVARAESGTYDVARVWKGTLPPTLVLAPKDIATPCGQMPQFIPGTRYLVLLHEHQPADVYTAESAAHILRYLDAPQRVSAGDLLKMLRGWNRGSMTSEAMARWLREVLPVAEVDDWAVMEGVEGSLVLRLMLALDEWINRETVPAERACRLEVLRTRVTPVLIELLLHPARTREEVDALDAKYPDLEDLPDQLCGS